MAVATPLAKYVVEDPSNKNLIIIGSDHAGYPLRVKLVEYLKKKSGWDLIDVGVHTEERVWNYYFFFFENVKLIYYFVMNKLIIQL